MNGPIVCVSTIFMYRQSTNHTSPPRGSNPSTILGRPINPDNTEVLELLRQLIAKVDTLTMLITTQQDVTAPVSALPGKSVPVPVPGKKANSPPAKQKHFSAFISVPSTVNKRKVNEAIRTLCPTGFEYARPFKGETYMAVFEDQEVQKAFIDDHPTLIIDGQECQVSASTKFRNVPAPAPPPPPPTHLPVGVLLYDYDEPKTFVHVTVGEEVTIVQSDKGGWTYVQKSDTTKLYVPTDYLQVS